MTKSMIEFEGDLMLPGASSSRIAGTPKEVLGDLSYLING